MSTNKRRSVRFPVENVKGTMHVSAEARILNMSLTGMAVETATQLRVGRTYSVTLTSGEGDSVQLSGTIVWCHLRAIRNVDTGERSNVYHAGVSFTGTLTDKASQLVRILEKSAVVDVERRVAGRFQVTLGSSIDLITGHDFVVRTISIHGLLLETEPITQFGAIVNMEVQLDGEIMCTTGRVAFSREVSEPGKERISQLGIEYIDLADEERRKIERFISHLIT